MKRKIRVTFELDFDDPNYDMDGLSFLVDDMLQYMVDHVNGLFLLQDAGIKVEDESWEKVDAAESW